MSKEKIGEQIKYEFTVQDYQKMIIEMVKKIKDSWVLEQIFRCITNMTKED